MSAISSSRRAFKIAFMQKCAEAGMTPAETLDVAKKAITALEKQAVEPTSVTGQLLDVAAWPLKNLLWPGVKNVAWPIVKGVSPIAAGALLLGPPVAGLSAGYAAAKATDMDETDVDNLRKRRLVEEYRQQAQRLRERIKNAK